ncbi:MAG: ATP-binding protein [Actinobacteria bacterium]|nr:ATP-binding protein [Actinomycetota bacterium]
MQQPKSLIPRPRLLGRVLQALAEAPVTILDGARQTGKTTLAGMVAESYAEKSSGEVHHFDLERAATRAALSTPELTLEPLRGLVVIDEIQRLPELFATLRPLADRPDIPARFLVLGSASPDLVHDVSESLAGRVLFVHVPGFALDEVGAEAQDSLWVRGGFPRSWLAGPEGASFRWREAFITTFLERDVPQLGIRVPSETLRRFWTMLAHYHGQTWNASELARSLGATSKTALHYRDILAGAYVIRVLPPWFENLKKRQVKSPKVYIRDSGLLHTLLGIQDINALRSHPRYGVSWEGFALQQVLAIMGAGENAYFWGTQRGAELDLLLFRGGRALGFEFKCSDAPSMTKSMHIALRDLDLDVLYVVYPGRELYRLHEKVKALPLRECVRLGEVTITGSGW